MATSGYIRNLSDRVFNLCLLVVSSLKSSPLDKATERYQQPPVLR